jgi:nicotinamide-nucleotide amidase
MTLQHNAVSLSDVCADLAQVLLAQKLSICSAESCTGGMISAACTDLPGSSLWFERGFVTYSNAAKTDMLGVPASLIETHGAVSEEVARAMALGALAHSLADWSVAVTGVAGPSGGSAAKPVGTVWLAWACQSTGFVELQRHVFSGDRRSVRESTTALALSHLARLLQADSSGRLNQAL